MTMGEKLKKNEKLKNGVNFEELEKRNTKIRAELKYHVKIHKESVKLVEGARFSLFFTVGFRLRAPTIGK